MGFHTYPVERADQLEDPERYRYCSAEELVGALDLAGTETVVDLGVGTGFYAKDVVPHAGRVVGIDLQRPMLTRLTTRDPPVSVDPVQAAVDALPLADGAADAAFSTMTFHEYGTAAAHEAVHQLLSPGGRLVTVDWTSDGDGASGPSLDERFDLDQAVDQLQSAGFHIVSAEPRAETFLLIARAE